MGGTERFQENGIIQIENLVKRYGSFVALDHLNLDVYKRQSESRRKHWSW